ncbi:hypothetical protein, partial [uncultured Pseudomonas sp.]|uniref:hypothetical protein n=1 Tax=uncultured Pseudomonas sp. TaxID=114707 RepID=UPI002589AD8A
PGAPARSECSFTTRKVERDPGRSSAVFALPDLRLKAFHTDPSILVKAILTRPLIAAAPDPKTIVGLQCSRQHPDPEQPVSKGIRVSVIEAACQSRSLNWQRPGRLEAEALISAANS